VLRQIYDRDAYIISSLKDFVFAANFTEFEELYGYLEYRKPGKQYISDMNYSGNLFYV
jgi:hypothetical protein